MQRSFNCRDNLMSVIRNLDSASNSTSNCQNYKLGTTSLVDTLCNTDEFFSKSVFQPGFEQQHSIPSTIVSKRQLRKQRRLERFKTRGKKWFDMPAPEITDEIKKDLQVLKMRSGLDSKHFYKRNDGEYLPKYFQIGTVEDNAADFYHSRIPRKQRKRTLVEELLADADLKNRNKKKLAVIQAKKNAQILAKRRARARKARQKKGSNKKKK